VTWPGLTAWAGLISPRLAEDIIAWRWQRSGSTEMILWPEDFAFLRKTLVVLKKPLTVFWG